MKTIYILVALLPLLLTVSCDEDAIFDNDRRVTGFGDYESESVVVDDFDAIDLENVSNVYVTTGRDRKVVFTAYENILPYMEAVVIGDELVLRFNKNINVNSDKEICVDISVPSIDEVTLSGVGNFYLKGPYQGSLHLNLDGVGNIEAYDLPVDRASVDINGNGNVKINAKELLEVDIDGLGNVYYKGDPKLSIDINGLGEVIRGD